LSGKKRLSIAVFLGAGIASGILTLHPPLPPDGGIFLGAIFGVGLSVCLWIFHRPRSIARATAVIVSSTTAYIAALFSTIFAYDWVPKSPTNSPGANPPSYLMAVGGVVGALLLSATVLLLYRDATTKLAKGILVCTLAGGALGVFGYSLGFLFANHDPNRGADMPVIPLYVLWQAGMACLLATFLPEPAIGGAKDSLAGVSIFKSPEPSPREEVPMRVPLLGKLFVGLVALSLLAFVARTTWVKYKFVRQSDEFARYQMSHPSFQGLPPIEPITAEDGAVLHPIAGRTAQVIGPLINKATARKPEFVGLTVCYMHLPNERCGGNPPDVDVRITRYPNSAWSSYEMEGIHYGFGAGYFTHPKKIQKFGTTILADEKAKEPGKGKYYWVSGPTLIEINSSISDSDEFIKDYLERYPPL
jgi:hypothetical protein